MGIDVLSLYPTQAAYKVGGTGLQALSDERDDDSLTSALPHLP